MENNQTAVEWLVNHWKKLQQNGEKMSWNQIIEITELAKQMEKEQKQECWDTAHQAGRFEGKGIAEENWQTFEQYYNETYGKE